MVFISFRSWEYQLLGCRGSNPFSLAKASKNRRQLAGLCQNPFDVLLSGLNRLEHFIGVCGNLPFNVVTSNSGNARRSASFREYSWLASIEWPCLKVSI